MIMAVNGLFGLWSHDSVGSLSLNKHRKMVADTQTKTKMGRGVGIFNPLRGGDGAESQSAGSCGWQ